MKVVKLPFACSEFSVHAKNQRQTRSFVRTKFGFLNNMPFSFARLLEFTVPRWSHQLHACANQVRFPIYLIKPYLALISKLWQCNETFWLTSLTFYICALLKMLRVHLCTDVSSSSWILEPFWKLAGMFLNIFIGIRISKKWCSKKSSQKQV